MEINLISLAQFGAYNTCSLKINQVIDGETGYFTVHANVTNGQSSFNEVNSTCPDLNEVRTVVEFAIRGSYPTTNDAEIREIRGKLANDIMSICRILRK